MKHECSECTFIQDKEALFIFLVPKDLKERATYKPLFFNKFTMTGWVGHSGFYLFKCKSCDQVSIDYPHGYTSSGLVFLRCDYCQEKLPLKVSKERAIYERESLFIPADIKNEKSVTSRANNVWNVGLIILLILTLGMFLFRNSN